MPRLTEEEAAELEVSSGKYVDVSTEEYMAKRDALMDKAETVQEAADIAARFPDPARLAELEEAERRASEPPYPGYGRDLSGEEEEAYNRELEEAPDMAAARQVLKKYGRLVPSDVDQVDA